MSHLKQRAGKPTINQLLAWLGALCAAVGAAGYLAHEIPTLYLLSAAVALFMLAVSI